MSSPPVKLAQIAMGDGTVGSGQVYNLVPLVGFLLMKTVV
jgi:hypothetical protein